VIKGRMPYRACGPFLLALLLAACGSGTSPSAEENRQLDNAAEMLDAAPQTLGNIDGNALEPAGNTPANAGSAR
jgi:hypothetical protein